VRPCNSGKWAGSKWSRSPSPRGDQKGGDGGRKSPAVCQAAGRFDLLHKIAFARVAILNPVGHVLKPVVVAAMDADQACRGISPLSLDLYVQKDLVLTSEGSARFD